MCCRKVLTTSTQLVKIKRLDNRSKPARPNICRVVLQTYVFCITLKNN